MTTTEIDEANQVIEAFGGPSKLGALLGISKSAVSQWKQNGIPKTQMRYLRLAHPKVFKESSAPAPTTAVTQHKLTGEAA